MQAVVFDLKIPKYLAAKALGKRIPSFYYGAPSGLSMRNIEEPELPGDRWMKVKPTYAGVCGSDMGAIFFKTSPSLTPFNAFPSVLGHEVMGIVTEVGNGVRNVEVGQRISIDPYIGCEVRGRKQLCPACKEGMHTLCRHKGGDETFGPGMILGFCKDFPGGWGETLVIHDSMAIPLPDKVSDKTAAIIEPLSVGLHAVLRQPPKQGEQVLVIGGGMIAYTVIAALRLLDIDCHITHLSLMSYQREMGLQLGADKAITRREELRDAVLSFPETRKLKPIIGKDVYTGGYDSVYDCIGSESSLDDALRMTAGRGKVTLVGGAGEIKNLDWTFVWTNELSVLGTHAYVKEESWQGKTASTHELLLDLIEQHPDYPLETLITHEYDLDQYREAIVANVERRKYESIKTLFKI
ncbi:zinc-dependent alcohol dehydrogenase [Salicibibacter kimchii]|uniref:Alcohol dehydrogenase n=1 Tax=Salicibibacter kimchii TaxID=2099786 RepID=A0A345C1D1_9BACI|nr:alcohol dehydrogenase catalytic domain-containing protein [Salicibibacter kimchii]AXF57012.1 alcohol dehydrogenase [Salicibibacter kimchii]